MRDKTVEDLAGESETSPVDFIDKTFDALQFPVCIIGIKGDLIHSNREFRRLFNTDEDLVSLDWSNPFFPEYRRRIAVAYLRALKGQERQCFAVMRTSDGSKKPVEIYLYPMFRNTEICSILVFLKIVDDRMLSFDKSTSHLYDEEESGYDSNIFDFSPFPIVRLDHSGNIIKASASVECLFDYGVDEMKAKRNILFKSVTLYDFSRLRKSITRIWAGDIAFKRIGEVRIPTKGNEDKWVNVILYPISKDNRVVAVELILEDVTKLKRLESKLSYMNRLQIIGDLSKGLFHSFNNIIHVILSRAHLLLQLTEKNAVLEGLRVIEETAMKSVRQIRRIQNFISEGEKVQVAEEENLIEVIEDAIEFTKLQFKVEEKEKRRNIKIDRKYFALHNVKADGQLLREIFISMIFKVSSYIKKMGVVNITLRENNGLVVNVSVEDLDKSSSAEETARSVLLSDVDIRRIAERMNIKIIEEESQNSYSMKAILPSRLLVKKKREEAEGIEYKLRNLDVMIIEDEKELREILFEMFDRLGNRVYVYEGREQALSELKKGRFDVIITDYGLSGITGLELLARVKEIDENVVTVLLTGWILNEIKAYKNVVDLFVQKPFKLEVLIKGISRILKSRNL
jgi:PAS domain S-box-containing protein